MEDLTGSAAAGSSRFGKRPAPHARGDDPGVDLWLGDIGRAIQFIGR
jgi:hypothetical protein